MVDDSPRGPASPAAAPPLTLAQKRATRLVHGLFLALAIVFVGVSACEIIGAALGLFGEALGAEAGPARVAAGRECGEGLRQLAAALERAALEAFTANDETTAISRFHAGLLPEWEGLQAVEARCADRRGRDAFAALLRLRRVQEGFVRRQIVEIAPLRRDVSAYLPR